MSAIRLVAILIVSGCIGLGCVKADAVSSRSVILKPKHGPELVKGCYAGIPADITGSWMPSSDQVRQLEKALSAFAMTRLHRSVADDYKQYVGIIVQKKRLVFLSAFTLPAGMSVASHDWKQEPIVFCGGGDTVWRVAFDPEKTSSRDLI